MIKSIMASAIVMVFCVLNLSALEVSITDNWRYFAGDSIQYSENGYCDKKWDKVTLPHTWNAADLIDEKPRVSTGSVVVSENFADTRD